MPAWLVFLAGMAFFALGLGFALFESGQGRPEAVAERVPTGSAVPSAPVAEVTAAGDGPAALEPEPVAPPEEPATSPVSTDLSTPRARLAGLRRAERSPVGLPPYRRDLFGTSWADVDVNGCNQRDDVLLRDAVPGTVSIGRQGSCGHDVLSGTWIDPYAGRAVTLADAKAPDQAQAVQIDHVVALSEAWRSGASGWDGPRRSAYANDLDNLLAVDGPTNASKGDDDPAAWRPRKGYQCAYAVRWIDVKHRWHLAADPSEVAALEEMLGYCA